MKICPSSVLILLLCALACSCAGTEPAAAPSIPLLSSEERELLPARETKVTFRASAKNCRLFLNGEYQGNTSLTLTALPPGLYHLRVEKQGYLPADYMIEASEGIYQRYYVELVAEPAPATACGLEAEAASTEQEAQIR